MLHMPKYPTRSTKKKVFDIIPSRKIGHKGYSKLGEFRWYWSYFIVSGPAILRTIMYHAVGNYYLKYSWEYFMQNKYAQTYSFIVDNPNTLGNFSVVCWAEPTGRELPNTFPYLGVPEYFRQKNALHIWDIPAPPNKSCMRRFPPAWFLPSSLPSLLVESPKCPTKWVVVEQP